MISAEKKILIVEDEVVIAMDLQFSLQQQGYNVIGHLTRGEDVVNAIEADKPDIILMDIKLEGDIDGVDTAQMVYDNYNIPVIFITSYSNKTIIDRAKKTNPFGYIVKPFEERELFTNIELAFFKHDSEIKLKESEKKYRELSESIQQIIIEINSDGYITYLNEPGLQILGLTNPDLQDQMNIKRFIGENGFVKIKNRISNNIDSNSFSREHQLINKYGKHLFIEEFLSPIYINNINVGYRGILIDVTSKKLKETLSSLYNKITLLYDEVKTDPLEVVKFLLIEFKKHFFYIEDIYFNENDIDNQKIIKHLIGFKIERPYGKGYSEFVINSKRSLYLRGKDFVDFQNKHQLQYHNGKTVCWSGFPINFKNKNFGVFVFQSFKNENALTTSDFENLTNFFNNINSLFERVAYLQEIQKSEEKYKFLVNSINEGVIQVDLNTKINFVNQVLCDITEYTEHELLGMNLYQAFGLNSRKTNLIKREILDKRRGLASQYEMSFTTKSGVVKYLLINSSLFSNNSGKVTGFVATIIDITEKLKILRLIEESEQKFKAIFDQAAIGVAIIHSNTSSILEANKKYGDILGYTNRELKRLKLEESTHPDDIELYLEAMDKILSGQIRDFTLEKRHIKKTGEVVWTNITVSPLWAIGEEPTNHILIMEDITDRKRVEEGLRKSEIEKGNILKAMPDSFLVISKEGMILNSYCNDNETVIKQAGTENITGFYLKDILKESLFEKVNEQIIICFEQNKLVLYDLDFKSENIHNWFEIRNIPINSEEVLMIVRNVTAVRNNISELQKFYNITEQSKELIMITDKEGVIEYANPAFLQLSGYDMKEIVGQKTSILKSGKHSKIFYNELWSNILNGEAFYCRMINVKKNKETYIEEKIISPLLDANGTITHFISTGKDITEDLKRERKIKTYQKFEKTLEKKEQKYRTLALVQGQEKERIRIARELHDGLGQMLTVASANLDSINVNTIKNKDDKSKIEIVSQMVNEIIQESRRISYNLSPVGLYEFGLDAVLQQLIKRINSNYLDVKIKYTSNLKNIRFNSDIEINVYRIIQEAIQNSLRHSKASEMQLSLEYDANTLRVKISDNGIGFNVKQFGNIDKHFNGIKNIQERAKIIDAKVNFSSETNQGFLLELILKVKNIKNG